MQHRKSACAAYFLNTYFSLPSPHDHNVQCQKPNFTFYSGDKQSTMKFSFVFLNLDMVITNSTPDEFT